MKFQGQLDSDVLVNLLQYLHLNRASGVLRLQDARGAIGDVWTVDGRPVHAVAAGERGVEAVLGLMRWTSGRFAFRSGDAPPERTIDMALDALLLHVAHQTDERDRAGPRAAPIGPDAVLEPQRIDDARERGASMALSLDAIRLLPLLDGSSSLSELAARAGLGAPQAAAAAGEVVANGLARLRTARMVEAEFVHNVADLVRDIMGPLADIVVDEAMEDLGLAADALPESRVPTLLDRLAREFDREEWRAEFESRLAPLLARYGLTR